MASFLAFPKPYQMAHQDQHLSFSLSMIVVLDFHHRYLEYPILSQNFDLNSIIPFSLISFDAS